MDADKAISCRTKRGQIKTMKHKKWPVLKHQEKERHDAPLLPVSLECPHCYLWKRPVFLNRSADNYK